MLHTLIIKILFKKGWPGNACSPALPVPEQLPYPGYATVKRVHKAEKSYETGLIMCKEMDCTFHCRHLTQLRQHLSIDHGIEMNIEKKAFKNDEDTIK